MIDQLFGSLGTIAMATKNVIVYSTNYLDLGTISSKSRFTQHTVTPNLYAFWQPQAAMNAADSFIPLVYEATNSGFSTGNVYIVTAPQTALGLAQGMKIRYRMPETVEEFIELGANPQSTGTLTATTLNAWFEVGGDVLPGQL
jgi:hypothetical protein